MKKTLTRRALLMSALALVLCVSMLVGTTFAWFTDSVTSKNNIIKSGNLDVVLEYWNGSAFAEVTDQIALFDDEALWEPGYVQVAYLKVSNAGSLALKYQLNVNVHNETLGKNKAGEDLKLSDHLVFKALDITETEVGTYTRESAMAAAGDAMGLEAYNGDTKALEQTGDADYLALIIYMPTTVGNEANHDGVNIPQIEMGTNLFATQFTYEEDSFDDQYDADADLPVIATVVTTEAELKAAFEEAEEGDVIDATGVTAHINEVMANGSAAALEIPAGVTVKGATFKPTHRGGNYILLDAGANDKVIFENCIFNDTNNNFVIGSTEDGPDSVIYNNCTFIGQVITNFVDNAAGVAEFNGCTFTKATSGLPAKNFVEAMGGTHNFNSCTFDFTGVNQNSMGVVTSGCINVYSEAG